MSGGEEAAVTLPEALATVDPATAVSHATPRPYPAHAHPSAAAIANTTPMEHSTE